MSLLLFIIFSVLEVVRHWYVIEELHESPNKAFSFLVRASLAIVMSWYDTIPFYVALPTYGIVDWWLHDYLLNFLRGVKPIWYLNGTGPIDIFQNNNPHPYVWFLWKTTALIGFLGMYYINTY